jgi:tetratricopeptide (TPR) repeat protein
MAEQRSNKSSKKKKSAAGSKVEVGDINVGRDLNGNIIVGNNNVINIPVKQAFLSLHQLPQPPADFTGREELIAQLLADFEKGKGAAITGQPIHGLIGMGGIGKTVLGLVVAHQLKKDYPDAQIFLDLKGTTTPLSAMDVMRHVILSFEPKADVRDLDEVGMSTAYQSVLHGKKALLFLDNARSAEQIAALRPPETCALLMTSRWTFGGSGLQKRHIGVMSQENAENFLLELCPRIADKVDELAKACACLPLALRIAGSFLQVNNDYSVGAYVAELGDKKAKLGTLGESREEAELRTEPDLVATFQQSYDQLAKEEVGEIVQKYWRTLGVFSTSFEPTALEAIWELGAKETSKLIRLYKRYSLIDFDENTTRYSLHDLLAVYALSQMNDKEEYKARLKHAAHYEDVLGKANDLYLEGGEKISTGLRLFDREWENIRTSQAWISAGGESPAFSELCVDYPNAGAHILDLRQHPRERIRWLEAALAAARQIGDRRGEGNTLGHLGVAYKNLSEVRKAIQFYEQALVIARELGDRRGEGAMLANLGNAYKKFGNVSKAIELHEQALIMAREIGDRRGEGQALGNLGTDYGDLGEARKAIEFHKKHLTIAREIGDLYGQGHTLGRLGHAYADLGETREAIKSYGKHLAISRKLGDRRGESTALTNLGVAYTELGEWRKAIKLYEQALLIKREIGHRGGEEIALGNLGSAYYSLGEFRKAIEFYKQSLAIKRETGDRRGEGQDLGSLGSAYFDLQEYAEAENYYRQQLTIVQAIGDRNGEGLALWGLAICNKQAGAIDGAREMFQKALEIFKEIESPSANTMQKMLDELDKEG